MGLEVVGVASTIDNDLGGSEITIGVDTALNIALEAIDRLKVTASSHKRAFLVEVMGRDCGYLALMAGIAGGAEAVVIPETEVEPEVLARDIQSAYQRGKPHALVVVAEGAATTPKLAQHFDKHRERLGFELRVTTLGHVQRGGVPGRLRPPAGDAAGRRRRRLPGARRTRQAGGPRARRGARHAAGASRRHAQGSRPGPVEATEGARAVIQRLSERQMALLVTRLWAGCFSTCHWRGATACGTRGRRTTPRSRGR